MFLERNTNSSSAVGRWIDWKVLRDRGFEGVVFDKDNTLTAPYALAVWPALTASLQECQSVFEGRIALLSNSAGKLVTLLVETLQTLL